MNLKPSLIALAAFSCFTAAQADIVTFTGNTAGGPTFNRPLEDLSALSVVGTAVAYDTYSFSASVAGNYTFLTTAAFDPFVFLYGPSFSAAAPLSNALIANDDLLGLTTSGFAFALTAGTPYVFVVAGFGNDDFGAYSTTVGGPGVITASVPEPQAYALMALGLGALLFARRYSQSRSL